MSNQESNKVNYEIRNQEFYDSYYNIHTKDDFKKKIRVTKLRKSGDSVKANLKEAYEEVEMFSFKIINTGTVAKIRTCDLFLENGKLNIDFIKHFDSEYSKYCFLKGGWMYKTKYLKSQQDIVTCQQHTACTAINNEIANLPFDHPFKFQEVFYSNLASEIVCAKSSVPIDIFPPNINSKTSSAFLRYEESKTSKVDIFVECVSLSLVPGMNYIPIDVHPNVYLEVKLKGEYCPNISIAQINNSKLMLYALNSSYIQGVLGFITDKCCKVTFKQPISCKLINVRLDDFKGSTYPIRHSTDSNVALIAEMHNYKPCEVSIILANTHYDDSFLKTLSYSWDLFVKFFNSKSLPTVPEKMSDLKKIKKIIELQENFKCSKCSAECEKLKLLDCFHALCDSCYTSTTQLLYNFCLVDANHRNSSHVSEISPGFLTLLKFEPDFIQPLFNFIEKEQDARVFSFISPLNGNSKSFFVEDLQEHLKKFNSSNGQSHLEFSVSSSDIMYENPHLIKFSHYNQSYEDDSRPITLIATKPTMFNVHIQQQFNKLFTNEGVTFVSTKAINFNEDDTFKKLYSINNTYKWAEYWRDYLNSKDLNFVCAIKVTNIPGFAKLFDQVRHSTGINWPKNSGHKSSSEAEASQNLFDFFPELFHFKDEKKRKCESTNKTYLDDILELTLEAMQENIVNGKDEDDLIFDN